MNITNILLIILILNVFILNIFKFLDFLYNREFKKELDFLDEEFKKENNKKNLKLY